MLTKSEHGVLGFDRRIHPLFPTPQETTNNPSLAYSDHLLLITKVRLKDKSRLTILSLNILGGIACSGIHALQAVETDEAITARYQRMIKGVTNSIEKYKVDILGLQEATPEYIVPVLRKYLSNSWKIIEDAYGIVTCYKKSRWNLTNTASDSRKRIRKLTLSKNNNPDILVDFHNIWGVFDQSPLILEKQCREALVNSTAEMAIIMGDTNSRLAPLDNKTRNITTGAIPLMFNKINGAGIDRQLPDFPDGGFYRGTDGIIHQLKTHVLDFENGSIVLDKRTEQECKPWLEYRMVMCLDPRLVHRIVMDNKTVFQYEQFLQKELGNPDILVRHAANSFNHKAIGIGIPKCPQMEKFFDFIQDDLNIPDVFSKTLEAKNSKNKCIDFYFIFMPAKKVDLLHETIELYFFKEKYPETYIHKMACKVVNSIEQNQNSLFKKTTKICKNTLSLLKKNLHLPDVDLVLKFYDIFRSLGNDKSSTKKKLKRFLCNAREVIVNDYNVLSSSITSKPTIGTKMPEIILEKQHRLSRVDKRVMLEMNKPLMYMIQYFDTDTEIDRTHIICLLKEACCNNYLVGIEEILNSEIAKSRMLYLCDTNNLIEYLFMDIILGQRNINVIKLVSNFAWFLDCIPAEKLQMKLMRAIQLYKNSNEPDYFEQIAFLCDACMNLLDREWVQTLFQEEDNPDVKKVLKQSFARTLAQQIPPQYLLFFGKKTVMRDIEVELQKKCLKVSFPEVTFSF